MPGVKKKKGVQLYFEEEEKSTQRIFYSYVRVIYKEKKAYTTASHANSPYLTCLLQI